MSNTHSSTNRKKPFIMKMDEFRREVKGMFDQQNEFLKDQAALQKHTADQTEHLIWQVMGNPSMNIQGIGPAVKELKKELSEVKEWRQSMWKIDLKKLMTAQSLLKTARAVAYMTGIGTAGFTVSKLYEILFK